MIQEISDNYNRINDQIVAEEYYKMHNCAILERRKQLYTESGMVDDIYSSNIKLPSGFCAELIDQKVNYSINSKMSLVVNGELADNVFGSKWRRDLATTARQASIKGFAVWQFYIEKGVVKKRMIPSEQIIPCYDDGVLYKVIRVYESRDGKTTKKVAEVWEGDTVSKWEQKTLNRWVCVVNKEPSMTIYSSVGGKKVASQPSGWGVPPFAILRNNEYFSSDITKLIPLVDAFDFTNSDFANNLQDFQDVTWIVKNYDGTKPSEFMRDVKAYKVLKISEDGEARQETTDIPFEAKMKLLETIEDQIYKFGRGVNTSKIVGNVTNVQIYSMYSNLDLKANDFEAEVESFVQQSASFITKGSDLNGVFDAEVDIVFDRSMIINKEAMIQIANQSIGAVSEQTRLANHPWVDNAEDEILRMENIVEATNEPQGI